MEPLGLTSNGRRTLSALARLQRLAFALRSEQHARQFAPTSNEGHLTEVVL